MITKLSLVAFCLGATFAITDINATSTQAAASQKIQKYNVFKRIRLNNNTYGVKTISNASKIGSSDLKIKNYSTTNYSKGSKKNGPKYKTQYFLPYNAAATFSTDSSGKVINYKMNTPANNSKWIPVSYTYISGNLYVYYENYSNSKGTDHGFLARYNKNVLSYAKSHPKFLQLATFWADRFNHYHNEAGYIKYYNETDVKKQGYSVSASSTVAKYAQFLKKGDIKLGYKGGLGLELGHGGSLTNYKGNLYLINDPHTGKHAGQQTLERFSTSNLSKPSKTWNMNFNDPWSGSNVNIDLHTLAFDAKGNFYSAITYPKGNSGYWSGASIYKGKISGNSLKLSALPLHFNAIGEIQGVSYNNSSKKLTLVGDGASTIMNLPYFLSVNSKLKTYKRSDPHQNKFIYNSSKISNATFSYNKFTNGARETEGGYTSGATTSYLLIHPGEIVTAKN